MSGMVGSPLFFRKFYILLRYNRKTNEDMSEVELFLIDEGENCTLYTLQFLRDAQNEFENRIYD